MCVVKYLASGVTQSVLRSPVVTLPLRAPLEGPCSPGAALTAPAWAESSSEHPSLSHVLVGGPCAAPLLSELVLHPASWVHLNGHSTVPRGGRSQTAVQLC